MASEFTRAVAKETLPAETVNQLMDALEGVAGKGHWIGATQVDDPDHYALDAQQHDNVHGYVARFRDSTGKLLLVITKDELTMAEGVTIDGLDPGAHTHSGAAGQGAKIPSGSLADDALSADAAGRAQMADGFLTLAKAAEKMAYSKDASDHMRLEIKPWSLTLDGDTDNAGVGVTWDTAFASILGAVITPVNATTSDTVVYTQFYLSALSTTGCTVRGAVRNGVTGAWSGYVLAIGIGTA